MSAPASDSRDGATAWAAPAGWLQSAGCRMSAYLPLEGLVAGRKVLDVAGLPPAQERLRAAKARVVMAVGAPAWQVPDGSVDVVLALGTWSAVDEAVLAEIARVLSPDGFVAWRFEATAANTRTALAARLSPTFASLEFISQVPIVGFSFDRTGSGGVVVAEDYFPTNAGPSHVLALAARGDRRPWQQLESWVVPLHRPEMRPPEPVVRENEKAEKAALESRLNDLSHEREYLREALMTSEDERERLERLAFNLRRDADRNLARLSEQAAALEVLMLERDHALRRLAAGEGSRAGDRPAGAAEELRKSPITSA